jgi:hypothetical protein
MDDYNKKVEFDDDEQEEIVEPGEIEVIEGQLTGEEAGEDAKQEEIKGQPTGEEAAEKKSGGMKLPSINMALLKVHRPYGGVFSSAMVLLIALTTGGSYIDDHKYYEYGIAAAVVAMVFALTGCVLAYTNMGEGKFGRFNNYFLFVWCFIGACFMTFGGPFEFTGNGYFGAWGMVVFAIMGLGDSVDNVKEALGGMVPTLGLLASSLIAIVAISDEGFDENQGELIYAIIVACITVLVLGVIIKIEYDNAGEPHMLKFPILAFFAVLWIILACLVTFRGPFVWTGNGYFGAWGGAITGVFAAMAAMAAKDGDSVQEVLPEE